VPLVCVCVNILGAEKSVHEGNLSGKCNSVSVEQKSIGPVTLCVHGSCVST